MKYLIVQGSSRTDGNTAQIADILAKKLEADIIHLKELDIHPYSYDHEHADDDFLPTMCKLVTYDVVIFATPVYWYTMSGRMKNFFDRITDCLKTDKETGRQLRGMHMAAISCGSDHHEVEGFFVPFRESAGYLGMHYLGDIHTWVEGDDLHQAVVKRLLKRTKDFFINSF